MITLAHAGGRPSDYTPELGEAVCEAIANSSKGLHRLFDDDPDFPSVATIYNWKDAHPEFLERYVRAKEMQVDRIAFESVKIVEGIKQEVATNCSPGTGQAGAYVNAAMNESKAKQWLCGHLAPKAVRFEHSGPNGGDIPISAHASLTAKLEGLALKKEEEPNDGDSNSS